MLSSADPILVAHLRRHARTLHRLCCGFGRARDADDILQTLYARWWRRMGQEPGWTPPESHVELFVCARRAVLDVVSKEQRERSGKLRYEPVVGSAAPSDEALDASQRFAWVVEHLPAPWAEVLLATLSAGRRSDVSLAEELGLTHAAFTARLFKARRAAMALADLHEHLSAEDAELMAALEYGEQSRAQLAKARGWTLTELAEREQRALSSLNEGQSSGGRVAS